MDNGILRDLFGQTAQAAQILGISGRAEMIHRDDLVVGGPRGTDSAK